MPRKPLKRSTALGQIITDLRMEEGLSTTELSKASGVSATLINGYERGKVSPNWKTLEKVLDVFGCEVEIVKK
jgi:transcriptional regulator with XRE-family HTH domain